MADDWTTCSHLACKLVESERHCNFHSSANPMTDLAAPLNTVAKVESSCHDVAGVQRISIFHHGSEQNGMDFRCAVLLSTTVRKKLVVASMTLARD
jgi:hypothetical protein